MKPLIERIQDTLPAHPDGDLFMQKVAADLEQVFKEWDKEQYEMMAFKPDFIFWESRTTPDNKKMSVKIESDSVVYKIRIAENDIILFQGQVLKP